MNLFHFFYGWTLGMAVISFKWHCDWIDEFGEVSPWCRNVFHTFAGLAAMNTLIFISL